MRPRVHGDARRPRRRHDPGREPPAPTGRGRPPGGPVGTGLVAEDVRLYPVGRLDWDVEGVLLLTNDGALTHRLLHPRYALPRVYEARVQGRVARADLARWRRGGALADGPAPPRAA